jgi:hypothetical protein
MTETQTAKAQELLLLSQYHFVYNLFIRNVHQCFFLLSVMLI